MSKRSAEEGAWSKESFTGDEQADQSAVGNIDELIDTESKERLLPVVLTQEERLQIGEEICQAQASLEAAQAAKKAAVKQYDGEIERHKEIVSMQAHTLRLGRIDKLVEVKVIRNYRTGRIKEVRQDTSEVLTDRVMSPSERQRGLKL